MAETRQACLRELSQECVRVAALVHNTKLAIGLVRAENERKKLHQVLFEGTFSVQRKALQAQLL